MKIVDTVLSYAGDYHPQSKGMCRLRVFSGDDGPRVLITDLGPCNNGRSVTNAIETIVERIEDSGLALGATVYIEHYERPDPEQDTFDQVRVSPGVNWQSISREAAIALLGCSPDELEDRTEHNKRIVGRTETLRLSTRRFDGSPWPESPEVIKRKLEIADGMISRSSVRALVEAGSGERELQRLLKSDLSIVAEAFTSPDDEYICFSEFPFGDGYVDFAVFTGRSRMDVILIEVKEPNSTSSTATTTRNSTTRYWKPQASSATASDCSTATRSPSAASCTVSAQKPSAEVRSTMHFSAPKPLLRSIPIRTSTSAR